MIAADEDALICDFAETYHIYNYRSLPPTYAATLAIGLRDDARIKIKLSGTRVSAETMLQAASVDALNFLVWAKTKDGQAGRNRPESVLQKLLGTETPREIMAFTTAAEFEETRKRLLNGG